MAIRIDANRCIILGRCVTHELFFSGFRVHFFLCPSVNVIANFHEIESSQSGENTQDDSADIPQKVIKVHSL